MRTPAMLALVALGILNARAAAQDAERPVPFDTGGRIVSISPSLATRLSLTAPSWPVTGEFVEARLFERTAGDFVIAAERPDGSISRYVINANARRVLAQSIAAAMVTTGGLTAADRTDLISESAGGSFARRQLVAGLLVYGPSLAALSDGSTAGAMYFLGAGAAYFIASGISRSQTITRAQSTLANDGTYRGAVLALGLRHVIDPTDDNGDDDSRSSAVVALAGAITGAITGFNAGRGLTDSEAASATLGSTTVAAVTTGAIGMTAGFDGGGDRGKVAAIVTSALVGYPLGLSWVRRANYRVTAGDVSALWTGALVGSVASFVVLPGETDESGRASSAIVTAGYLGGLYVMNQALAKPFDLTDDEASSLRWSSLAGGAIGLGVAAMAKASNGRAVAGLAASGAILGMASAWPRKAGRAARRAAPVRIPGRSR